MNNNHDKQVHPVKSSAFIWRDSSSAKAKLDRFKHSGNHNVHLVWDWDGTIVEEVGTTWHALRDALPTELQKQHRELYYTYKPLEDRGELTKELEYKWILQALSLQVKNSTAMEDLLRTATKVRVRMGADQAFAVCEELGVPTLILSSGIKDIIAMISQNHGIKPTDILATELTWIDGKVSGWNETTIIMAKTKREKGHPQLSKLRKQRPHAILFGNRPHDAFMFEGDGLRIRVDGHLTIGTSNWESYLDESWSAGYDGVTIEDDLVAVAELNAWLLKPSA